MAINFPNSPSIGDIFLDTTSGFSYEWTGSLWKSFSSGTVSNIQILDDISGSFNNSLTTFNLTVGTVAAVPANAQQLEIILGGIQQAPGVDYTVSSSTVSFTTAPTNGLTFSGKLLGTALSLNTIPADTDGSGLVSLNASELDSGTVPDARFPATLPAASGANLTTLNASELDSGTVPDARFPATLPAASGANLTLLPAANLSGTASAINGSNITDLNGSNIASGTVAAARVATLNQNTSGTAAGLSGTPDITIRNLTGVAATFTGVLTYEDVTNVDSVGVITARAGIKFGLAGVGGTITADGHAEFVGVCTASSFDGRVPQIPQNVQGGTYTLVNSDAGKHINAGGNVTVNSGIFAIGDAISVFNDTGGDITIIQGSSVTLRLVADTSTGTRTLANYGLACILCVGSNEFVVSGGGVT